MDVGHLLREAKVFALQRRMRELADEIGRALRNPSAETIRQVGAVHGAHMRRVDEAIVEIWTENKEGIMEMNKVDKTIAPALDRAEKYLRKISRMFGMSERIEQTHVDVTRAAAQLRYYEKEWVPRSATMKAVADDVRVEMETHQRDEMLMRRVEQAVFEAVGRHSPQLIVSGVPGEIAEERKRQVEDEGYSEEHDDCHSRGELAFAAGCYAYTAGLASCIEPDDHGLQHIPSDWPWDRKSWKPKDKHRNLIRAAALIIAEIERLDRIRIAEFKRHAIKQAARHG